MISLGLLHKTQQNITKNIVNFTNYMATFTKSIAKL